MNEVKQYRVVGVDRKTKRDVQITIEATTPENARVKAEMTGIVITEIQAVRQRQAFDWWRLQALRDIGFKPGPWVWIAPVVPWSLWATKIITQENRLYAMLSGWVGNGVELVVAYALFALAGIAGGYLNWHWCGKRQKYIVPGCLIALMLVFALLFASSELVPARASRQTQTEPAWPTVALMQADVFQHAGTIAMTAPMPELQSGAILDLPPGFVLDSPTPTPDQIIADHQRLIELLAEIEANQSHQAAEPTLRLRRWWLEWDPRGRGTLTLQLANHGNHRIHLNTVSVTPGRWTHIAQYVRGGETLTHRVAVDREPVYVDLETSEGVLRFDLISD